MKRPVTQASPTCPRCGAELKLGSSGRLDCWSCPKGDGLGFTLSEAYERIPDDDISQIWHDSEHAPAGNYACPMCGERMAAVTSHGVTLDVCRDDELLWFDAGTLDSFPRSTPEPPPSPDELARIAQIRAAFDHDLDEAAEAEENRSVLDRLAGKIARHHPGFVGFLDHAVYHRELDDLRRAS